MAALSPEEQAGIKTVAAFVDREVRPVVRELEHADEYPEKLIAQMKELGVYGLAVPEPWGRRRSRCPATRSSPPSWPAAG